MRTTTFFLLLAIGCGRPTTPPESAAEPAVTEPAETAPVAEPPDAAEASPANASAKPGINDNFLDPEMDVDKWVERFGAESREVVANQAAIVAAMNLQPGAAVADIGAGTGLYMKPFAEAVGAEGKVFAVDISPKFLEHLGAMASDAGYAQVQTIEAGERSSNLPEGSVDAVFICDTYHHFEYVEPTLASIRAALKPGGKLFVIDFVREEGSSEWILEHVRGGQDVFASEIEAAGFTGKQVLDVGLTENYMLAFTRGE
ncbi:MAG: methyltransferase domain-containing protein [Deltaproteobacteria bacterium]|nr:MAG: methyltransferase domain-containing protein [Deltaproteobacteria bacterium]